jgi:hypothetical protein
VPALQNLSAQAGIDAAQGSGLQDHSIFPRASASKLDALALEHEVAIKG